MAGLLAYAAVGAIQGAGDGIIETARNKREDSIRAMENTRQDAQRAESRSWQVEDRNFAVANRRPSAASTKTYQMTSGEIGRLQDELFGPDANDRDIDTDILESYIAEVNRTMGSNPGMRYSDARDNVFGRENMTEGSPATGGDDWIPFNEKPAIEPERTGTFSSRGGLNAGTQNNGVAETGAPAIGEVIDGYKFKGGDPSVQANWDKV